MATVGGAVANILKTGGVRFSSLSNNSLPLPLPLVRTSSYSWSITATARSRRQLVRRVHPSYCTVSTDATSIAASEEEEQHDSNSSSFNNVRDAANLLDLRVGLIVKAWRHQEADSLYVEEVDVGETEPRIICSGLVNYIPQHLLENRKVVVLANLKPRNMRGVKSSGMLLAASDASHQFVELLLPPHTSLPGQRIWFGSPEDQHDQPAPATPNQVPSILLQISASNYFIHFLQNKT